MARRAGFGEDPSVRGIDLTSSYRSANPALDKGFVKRQIEPYRGAGLSQNIADFRGKSDTQLYDAAAAAVIKLAGLKPGGSSGSPAPAPKPPKPPAPKRKRRRKPAPAPAPKPRRRRKPKGTGGGRSGGVSVPKRPAPKRRAPRRPRIRRPIGSRSGPQEY